MAIGDHLLLRGSCFLSGLLAKAFVKAIYAASGVDQFLLPREKRMASRADFHVQVALFCRARLESFATRTSDSDFVICGMNFWLHYSCFLVFAAATGRFSTNS